MATTTPFCGRLPRRSSADRKHFLASTREQLAGWRDALADLHDEVGRTDLASRALTEHAVIAAEQTWSSAQHALDVAQRNGDTSWDVRRQEVNETMRQLAGAVRLAIESHVECCSVGR